MAQYNENLLDIYADLQVDSICKSESMPPTLNDFGLGGKAITYSLAISSSYSKNYLEKYMQRNGVSKAIGKLYQYKIIGNYGILSYLYKKVENKSNQRATAEVVFEAGVSKAVDSIIKNRQAIKQGAKKVIVKSATKIGINLGSRILAGSATGATIGTSFPIVGTIVGAVVGALIAGFVEDLYFGEGLFEDKDKKQKLDEQQTQDKLYKIYTNKLNLIKEYLLRNKYIELRALNESESETLCKHLTNPNESYFKSILIMQSFPKYLDRDKTFYESLKQNTKETKEIKITPIKDANLITIEIEKCFDTSRGEVIKNKQVYIYNEKFQRVVAKGKIDSKGYLRAQNVSVDKKDTIDKLSFIADRDNFSEDNFDISIKQYAPIINVQKYHKQTKTLSLPKLSFSFRAPQKTLQCNYEVESLEIHKQQNRITIIPKTNAKDIGYKRYINLAYIAFDLADTNIDSDTKNITSDNRLTSGFNYLGDGLQTQFGIKQEWKNKIVAFFAYFNNQKTTPFQVLSFVEKPILILDAGHGGTDGGAISPNYNQDKIKESELNLDIVKHIDILLTSLKNHKLNVVLTRNTDKIVTLDNRINIAENIYRYTQSKKMLFLSIHINSADNTTAKGLKCYYNKINYAKDEERFMDILASVIDRGKDSNLIARQFKNTENFRVIKKITNMPSVLVECGFLSNPQERQLLATKAYRAKIAGILYNALIEYFKGDIV
ncbi:N-acetylmuramoyl-L-alanine amidase [Helicobacter sp. T3_23-1056]